jgi:hypothetical protein
LQVEDDQAGAATGQGHALAVGVEGQGVQDDRLGKEGPAHLFAGRYFVQAQPRADAVDHRQGLAVRAEGNAGDVDALARQDEGRAPGGRVPEAHGGVGRPAARGHPVTIRTEGDAVHWAGVPLASVAQAGAGHVPEPDRAVGAAGGQRPAVGAEGQAQDTAVGTADGDGLALRVPQAQRAVVAARGQALAVGAAGHGTHPFAMAAQLQQRGPAAGVADGDLAGPARYDQARAVGAEGQGAGRAGAVGSPAQKSSGVEPFEEVPLPAAPAQRAFVEQLLGAQGVAGQPLALGQGDVAEVELLPGGVAGGLGVPALGTLGLPGFLRDRARRQGGILGRGLRPGQRLGPPPLPQHQPEPHPRQQQHQRQQPGDGRPASRPLQRPLQRPGRPGADGLAGAEAGQVVGQLPRGEVAAGGLLVQTFQADRLQVVGDRRLQASGRDGILGEHLGQRVERGGAFERRPAGEALVEDRSQRIDVAGRPDGAGVAAGLLGGHVTGRAQDGAAARLPSLGVEALGEAEVGDLGDRFV